MTTERISPTRTQPDCSMTLRHGRSSWKVALVTTLASGVLGAFGPMPRAAGADARPADDPARAFFARHCQSCHAGPKPKGDFRLDGLSLDFGSRANRDRWLAVLEQLKTGAMPPKGKPRPPD